MYRSLTTLAAGGLLALTALPAAHAASQASYTFPPTDFQGWTQVTVPGGTDNDYRFFPTSVSFGNRITWQDPVGEGFGIGGVVVTSSADFDARGSTHNTAVLRSPSFTLNGLSPSADIKNFFPTKISFKLLAGGGSPTGPANFAALPSASVDNGASGTQAYLGVGLRRVSDGAYMLWGHRSSNAQSAAWETINWDKATLAAATSTDAPGTVYSLDFVDAGHGNWGWVAMDSLTMISETSVVNVSVKSQDVIGAETGTDHQLSIRFSRDNNLTQPLDIFYAVEGTAFESSDYQPLPNYVGPGYKITIPAGKAFVDLPVNIIPNTTTEFDRSVVVRLLSSSDYLVTAANVASVWISDIPQSGLTTVSGPLPIATYLSLANPLTATTTSGSLLFYGEGNYNSGFMTIGIRTGASDNTANGGVDLGRNTAVAANSIYDYLDNKGALSTAARVPATTNVPILPGHYTMVGEIQFQDANTGTIKSWIWDGQNGSLDYNNPNVVTTFSSGFINTTDQLYLRLDGNSAGTTWTNARAIWAPGTAAGAAEMAFAQLTPARPFVYVDAPAATAGESDPNQDLTFSIFRSGPPKGSLTVPLVLSGTADAADFSTFPASVTIADGQSKAAANYHVIPDNLNEGVETLTADLNGASTWLVGTPVNSSTGFVLDRPFQDWMAYHLPGNQDGPQADSDGDGWSNLLEYFSGTELNDPASRSNVLLVQGATPALRYQRQSGLTDVTGQVMWSTDLARWHATGESDGIRTVTITEQTVTTQEGGPDTVEAKAAVTTGPAVDKLFLRLAVDLP